MSLFSPSKKILFVFLLGFTCASGIAISAPLESVLRPYSRSAELMRGEELFNAQNFREALIFYYEAINGATETALLGKIHFRIGECLEAIRRFEYAEFHYKSAFKNRLPPILASRVLLKLKQLPALAQHEEALRLFKKAIDSY
ncbi:hypothetical protein HYY75_01815, partial [bacterium]|nr:hypothetical protein [bacterium]